jgi:hypothetical protein
LEVDKQRLQSNVDNLKQKFRILQNLAAYKSGPAVEQVQEQFHQEYLAEYYGNGSQPTATEATGAPTESESSTSTTEPGGNRPAIRQTQSSIPLILFAKSHFLNFERVSLHGSGFSLQS